MGRSTSTRRLNILQTKSLSRRENVKIIWRPFREIRDGLLPAHDQGVTDEEELVLLYDLNTII